MCNSVPLPTAWSYRPYQPFLANRGDIPVTRIVPNSTGFSVEWTSDEAVEIRYGKWQEGFAFSKQAQGNEAVINGLEPETDYQFQLWTADGRKSLVRLVRTGDYLYTPIQYLHPEDTAYAFSGRYLCSPTIVRQADGSLLASMDLFVGGGAQNLTLPDGKLYVLTRYGIHNCVPDHGLAILYRVQTDDPEKPPVFDRTIPFPGNHSKFTVRQDEKTGRYYSIVSWIKDSANRDSRNLLSLICSEDGIRWQKVRDLIDFSDRDSKAYGFQYVDFFIEGDDVYYVCRTAINEANSFHNSNVILFHIIRDFRNL